MQNENEPVRVETDEATVIKELDNGGSYKSLSLEYWGAIGEFKEK